MKPEKYAKNMTQNVNFFTSKVALPSLHHLARNFSLDHAQANIMQVSV